MSTMAVPSFSAAWRLENPAAFTASATTASATACLSLFTAAALAPTLPSRGSATVTVANLSAYLVTASTSSSYSAPCMRWVGWMTRFLTPLFTARSRAWSMLSMNSPSRAWT